MFLSYSGAAQADVAVLVINATKGEFETGFDTGGQTREHTMLVRSLGKTNFVQLILLCLQIDVELCCKISGLFV